MLCNNQSQPSTTAYNPSDLLTTEEAASFLRFSGATLRNQRHRKQGPAFVRVGKRAVRYRFSDLEAFIAASTPEVA
jgi:hypothetical protein